MTVRLLLSITLQSVFLTALIAESISFRTNDTSVKIQEVSVAAPFEMSKIKVPDFSSCPRFLITDFGAVKGDKLKTTSAIDKAITAASFAGGGVVVVPAGEWLTAKIHFKSDVNLYLSKGAILLFSDKAEDYLPAVHTSWEGLECYNYSPLIYAWQCRNIAISGEGELKAQRQAWKEWEKRPPAHMNSIKRLYNLAWTHTPVEQRMMVDDSSHLRPHFIQFNRCENVLLTGITITNSPFWTIHPYLCRNVTLNNLRVFAHGHNNDGVDPEMSENVLIEHCTFDQGDDAIAVKSGRNPEGWYLKRPSKNIVIRNCIVKNGHQLLAIGSELSGGIENVFIDSCMVTEGAKMDHLIFIKTNERMGGYVSNIYAGNIKSGNIRFGVLGIDTDVLYQWRTLVPTFERRLTPVRDIYLSNITAGEVRFISQINEENELPVAHVKLNNVSAVKVIEQEHIRRNIR